MPACCDTMDSTMLQFADNTAKSQHNQSLAITKRKLVDSFVKIETYCVDRGLKINVAKTQYIIFKAPSKKLDTVPEITSDVNKAWTLRAKAWTRKAKAKVKAWTHKAKAKTSKAKTKGWTRKAKASTLKAKAWTFKTKAKASTYTSPRPRLDFWS